MPRGARVRETNGQIAQEIERAVREQAMLEDDAQKFAEEVRDHWRYQEAPVDTGHYAASIKVRKLPSKNGLPMRRVTATDFKAHWIEYGTGEPGPTKAYAPGEKTAHHFGGTLDEGIEK